MIRFFVDAFLTTLRHPRSGLRRILDLRLSAVSAGLLVALSSIVSTLLVHANIAMLPEDMGDLMRAIFGTPFVTLALQLLLWAAITVMLWMVGRWRGGQASFAACLTTTAWIQIVMAVLQALQTLTDLALPPITPYIAFFTLGLLAVMLVVFTAEVHGFKSLVKVAVAVLLTGLVTLYILSYILSLFLSPEALSNGL